LVVQDIFSNFVLIHPLKSKTATEMSRIFLYQVFQTFNVKKILTDNGPVFRQADFLATCSALGCKVLATAALHPEGRGQVERTVGLIKQLMKKLIAVNEKEDLNWELLPLIVSKVFNNTVSPKTGFKPYSLIFGDMEQGEGFQDLERYASPHYLIKHQKEYLQNLNTKIKTMTDITKARITELRVNTNEKLNEKRSTKDFKTGDIVFIVDMSKIPGNPRVLKTTLSNSPYLVLRPLWSTTLIRRIVDNFVTLYPNKLLKKFDTKDPSPLFNTLPPEVSKVLLNKFTDLIESDFSILAQHDPLDVPKRAISFSSFDNEAKIKEKTTSDSESSSEEEPDLFDNPIDPDNIEPDTNVSQDIESLQAEEKELLSKNNNYDSESDLDEDFGYSLRTRKVPRQVTFNT
jgi:hypothetical protein